MIANERHSVYKISNFCLTSDRKIISLPAFSINLCESQGFSFNQDLFVSEYDQKSGLIFDGIKNYNAKDDNVIIDSDEDIDDEETDYDYDEKIYNRKFTRSYSASNNDNICDRVKVIEIEVDENDL